MPTSEIQVLPDRSAVFVPNSVLENFDENEIGYLVREAYDAAKPQPVLIDPEKQIEIVNGKEFIKEMASAKHSGIGTRLIIKLGVFLDSNPLGRVYGADATFTIGNNDRMPDVSFVLNEKIPNDGEPLKKWLFAPDLAIEVISPTDMFLEVAEKTQEYFEAGVRQVWLIDSKFDTVTVYYSPTKTLILTAKDELTCEDILPGFRLKLSDIFID
jgi:Uma2 family endonuclease